MGELRMCDRRRGPERQAARQALEERVLKAIRGRCPTPMELSHSLRASYMAVAYAAKRLAERGLIFREVRVCEGRGRSQDTVTVYRLAEEEAVEVGDVGLPAWLSPRLPQWHGQPGRRFVVGHASMRDETIQWADEAR